MALPLSLSLLLPCAGLTTPTSPTFFPLSGTRASSSPPKTLTLAPAHQLGLSMIKRNKRWLSVRARQSQPDYYQTSRPQDDGYGSVPNGQSARVFANYSIYKGKAALNVAPKAPEFAPLDSGMYKVSREGCVFLQFAPGIGNRQFDWTRKQVFTLSVAEIGTLISLGPKDSCDFYHDPFLGKNEEGQVRKILKAEPLPDGSGHSFNLSVNDRIKNVEENIYIPITKGEFVVLRSCLNYLIPHLLGWNTFANSISPGRGNSFSMRNDLEWDR